MDVKASARIQVIFRDISGTSASRVIKILQGWSHTYVTLQ